MKKEIKIALLVFIGFIAFLWLGKFLREFMINQEFDELHAKYISGIIIRTLILGASLYLIKLLKLSAFTGLRSILKGRNLHAIIIVMGFIVLGISNNWDTYRSANGTTFILFVISVLLVGLVEELIFRGTILPLFIKSLKHKKNVLMISAILVSLLFGAVHYLNLFRQPGNFGGITSQVFFALSIGVFFSGLMLRTENILIPALIHGLVNFAFGPGELKRVADIAIPKIEAEGINWNTVIPTGIFFLFIMIGGLYMIWKTKTEDVLKTLDD